MSFFVCLYLRFRVFVVLLLIFGFVVLFVVVYTVEFQKRGLPHAHMLVWLDCASRAEMETSPKATTTFIDNFVSAELPDVSVDPLAYALVDEFRVHGPCGRMNVGCPCMKGGVCSKRFPKSIADITYTDSEGFPVYRRRDDGRFVMKGVHRLDNRWVVPHNVQLLKKYQAHINIEWCNKTHFVKYLSKYITKVGDRARARMEVLPRRSRPTPAERAGITPRALQGSGTSLQSSASGVLDPQSSVEDSQSSRAAE